MDFGEELCPACRAKALKDAKRPPKPPLRADRGGCLIPLLALAALAAGLWLQRQKVTRFFKAEYEQAGPQDVPKDQPQPAPAEEAK